MEENQKSRSLGDYLKSERERRGFSLEQVSSVTKIGVRVLQALEQDRYSELPALPFVKGFVKTYCQLLQLDSRKVLQDFDAFLQEKALSRPNREGGMSGYAFERPEGDQAKKMLWIVLGVLSVFSVLVILVFKPALRQRHHGSVARLQASATPSPLAVPMQGSPSPLVSGQAVIAAASPAAVADSDEDDFPSPSPSPSLSVAATIVPSASPKPSVSPQVATLPPLKIPETPLVLLSPKPTPAPVPTQVPSPSAPVKETQEASVPAPAPAPSVTPTAQASASAADLEKDPLQTGVDYDVQQIRQKVVVRALTDVWVRYRCDGKNPMRFILKTGRVLVLRGLERIYFQASNTASVNVSAGGRNYRPMSTHPQVFQYSETPTLVWPEGAKADIAANFAVRGALPSTPDPVLGDTLDATPSPTVSPSETR